MPSASQAQRDLMNKWFGSIDICGPLELLLSHGFEEVMGYISPPVPSHHISEIENACLDFLFYEWDFCYGKSGAPTYT